MFNIHTMFKLQHAEFYQRHPWLSHLIIAAGKKMWMQDAFVKFAELYPDLKDEQLLARGFEYINVGFQLDEQLQAVPKTGRLVIVANHPLGYLDGLGLVQELYKHRDDVKILVNNGLHNLLGMPKLTIGVDSFKGVLSKTAFKSIKSHLENEGVIVIFPSGLVSRKKKGKLYDMPWNSSFVRFAKSCGAPVLPIFFQASNSPLFYFLTRLSDPIAKKNLFVRELMMMKLLREIFSYQTGKTIYARCAPLVNLQSECFADCEVEQIAEHIRTMVYQLDKS